MSRKHIFVWLLPFLWAVCSVMSFRFPGDEYGLYAISSMVGTWIVMVVDMPGDIHHPAFWISITVTGAIIMSLAGLVLSLLRAKIKLWLILYIAAAVLFFAVALSGYPSIERALSKNGSLWAYIFSSLNMGLYASVVLCGIVSGIVQIQRRKL